MVTLVGIDPQPHQQQVRPHPNVIRLQGHPKQQRPPGPSVPFNRSPNPKFPKNQQVRQGIGGNDPRCALSIPPGPNG